MNTPTLPWLQKNHAYGPLLHCTDGGLHWLTRKERMQLSFNRTTIQKINDLVVAARAGSRAYAPISREPDAEKTASSVALSPTPWPVPSPFNGTPLFTLDPVPEPVSGAGGAFDGGGASASWDGPAESVCSAPSVPDTSYSPASSSSCDTGSSYSSSDSDSSYDSGSSLSDSSYSSSD